jgi:hypothetical protein
MRFPIAAAFALASASSLSAQTTTATPADFTYATPLPGVWTYSAIAGGSEATFRDSGARPQLVLRCMRAARQVTVSKPASGDAPYLVVWTSSMSRSVPASFDPATARVSATLAAYDALLDAMVFSRGRIAVSMSGSAALVVPAWPEVTRVVEDCRA